jgi:cytoskeletal protein RodZ
LIFSGEPGAFSVTCPTISTSQTSLIVAVVVGVTVGVVLVAFLVVFIIWYQFFRRADVTEETSRESAFDFSKKRMESTNPMANNAPDVKSDDGNDVSNTAKSTSPTSPTSPHSPINGEPEKTDLSGKSNGKDETNL